MVRFVCHLCIGLLVMAVMGTASAQHWGEVTGEVTDAEEGAPLPGVTVLVPETNYGTATGEDGRFRLQLPEGDYDLQFSAIGYETRVEAVTVREGDPTRLSVALAPEPLEMEGVVVEEGAPQAAGAYELDPEDVHSMPTPFKDGFRALKTMPGVATNNELSQQYSVRGGGYNENLIFINGFEVHMPFRPRQGEQEGLGLLNPDMAESITFHAGGFPARYGGKLSSALDVDYAAPEAGDPVSAAGSASLLDASAHAQGASFDGRLGWAAAVRRAQPGRFFGTQELRGDYDPRFTDVQVALTGRLAEGHTLEATGIWADHRFELDPDNQRTYFGALGDDGILQAMWTDFEGFQRDGYTTRFGGLRLTSELGSSVEAEHALAHFGTEERERFDIQGSSELFEFFPEADDPLATRFGTGQSSQLDQADNRVEVRQLTGRGTYRLALDRHALELGWHVRGLRFDDRINERTVIEARTSGGQETERIVADSLADAAELSTMQAGAYVQDVIDVLPTSGRLTVTPGLRADYYAFNDEWTISPRLSARFRATERLTLTGSWGIYHQKPTYRELRGTPDPGEPIRESLNRDLSSQRSMEFIGGAEYFLMDSRLYLRAEAYYKDLSDLISYEIDNIRVNYSGENDARGYTYGLDLQVRGELVPGLESWFNYSYLISREQFLPEHRDQWTEGVLPRPADQRHTFSAFVQDYVPGSDEWRLHLRALYGSGLPFTPPVPAEASDGSGTVQVPGPRMSERLPAYRRADLGATREIELAGRGEGRAPVQMDLTVELLNVFDMTNTVAFSWVPEGDGTWERVPQRLTPRTLNARVRVHF